MNKGQQNVMHAADLCHTCLGLRNIIKEDVRGMLAIVVDHIEALIRSQKAVLLSTDLPPAPRLFHELRCDRLVVEHASNSPLQATGERSYPRKRPTGRCKISSRIRPTPIATVANANGPVDGHTEDAETHLSGSNGSNEPISSPAESFTLFFPKIEPDDEPTLHEVTVDHFSDIAQTQVDAPHRSFDNLLIANASPTKSQICNVKEAGPSTSDNDIGAGTMKLTCEMRQRAMAKFSSPAQRCSGYVAYSLSLFRDLFSFDERINNNGTKFDPLRLHLIMSATAADMQWSEAELAKKWKEIVIAFGAHCRSLKHRQRRKLLGQAQRSGGARKKSAQYLH